MLSVVLTTVDGFTRCCGSSTGIVSTGNACDGSSGCTIFFTVIFLPFAFLRLRRQTVTNAIAEMRHASAATPAPALMPTTSVVDIPTLSDVPLLLDSVGVVVIVLVVDILSDMVLEVDRLPVAVLEGDAVSVTVRLLVMVSVDDRVAVRDTVGVSVGVTLRVLGADGVNDPDTVIVDEKDTELDTVGTAVCVEEAVIDAVKLIVAVIDALKLIVGDAVDVDDRVTEKDGSFVPVGDLEMERVPVVVTVVVALVLKLGVTEIVSVRVSDVVFVKDVELEASCS